MTDLNTHQITRKTLVNTGVGVTAHQNVRLTLIEKFPEIKTHSTVRMILLSGTSPAALELQVKQVVRMTLCALAPPQTYEETATLSADATLSSNTTMVYAADADLPITSTINADLTIPIKTIRGYLNGSAFMVANATMLTDPIKNVTATLICNSYLNTDGKGFTEEVLRTGVASGHARIPSVIKNQIPTPVEGVPSVTYILAATAPLTANATMYADVYGSSFTQAHLVASATITAPLVATRYVIAQLYPTSSLSADAVIPEVRANLQATTTMVADAQIIPSEPSFEDVVFLSSFEGATVIDESNYGHAITLHGSTAASTSQFKFGTKSLERPDFFAGGLTAAAHSAFNVGSQPFTMEAFIRIGITASSGTYNIISHYDDDAWPTKAGWSFFYQYAGGGSLGFEIQTASDWPVFSHAWTPSADTWYHVAVDFDGTAYRFFVDGVMIGKTVASHTGIDVTADLSLGCTTSSGVPVTDRFNGFMDEARVTVGASWYSSDAGFTPPTEEFPSGSPDLGLGDLLFKADFKNAVYELNGSSSSLSAMFENGTTSSDGTYNYVLPTVTADVGFTHSASSTTSTVNSVLTYFAPKVTFTTSLEGPFVVVVKTRTISKVADSDVAPGTPSWVKTLLTFFHQNNLASGAAVGDSYMVIDWNNTGSGWDNPQPEGGVDVSSEPIWGGGYVSSPLATGSANDVIKTATFIDPSINYAAFSINGSAEVDADGPDFYDLHELMFELINQAQNATINIAIESIEIFEPDGTPDLVAISTV